MCYVILNNIITALTAILRSTSPTSIGLSPGFLSSEVSLQATNDSNDDGDSSSSTHNFLINWANVLRKSNVAVPKAREVKILLQPSASRPDDPDHAFVNIEAFTIVDSSMSSYATGWIVL